MFTIGDFARNGRVSVRMLRHYDALGLLRPARVDAVSGYRSYDAGQLARLNRLVALKDLGFTLDQVRSILEDALSAAELSGMLRMRRAELQSRIAADTRRLGQVEARLRTIEMEGSMPTDDIQVKQIPAVRVAELSGAAHGFEPQSIGPVIGPLYNELMHQLREAGAGVVGPAIAYYEEAPDGGVIVHASAPVNLDARGDHPFDVVDLPAIAQAATIVHRGSMETVMTTLQTLARWIDASGHTSTGYNRELYLEYAAGDPDAWVTKLQEPVAFSDSHAHE